MRNLREASHAGLDPMWALPRGIHSTRTKPRGHQEPARPKSRCEKKSNLGGAILVVAFILATISGILMLNSPGRAFTNAQKRDTVTAYQSFLNNHGESEYAAAARSRAAVLDYAIILEYPKLKAQRKLF